MSVVINKNRKLESHYMLSAREALISEIIVYLGISYLISNKDTRNKVNTFIKLSKCGKFLECGHFKVLKD